MSLVQYKMSLKGAGWVKVGIAHPNAREREPEPGTDPGLFGSRETTASTRWHHFGESSIRMRGLPIIVVGNEPDLHHGVAPLGIGAIQGSA